MRTGADVAEIRSVLAAVADDVISTATAEALHARLRSLTGHWAATRYGETMTLTWPPSAVASQA